MRPSKKPYFFTCRCTCGVVKDIAAGHLRGANSRSCGCFAAEQIGNRSRTHGRSKTPLYNVWTSIIDRCTCPTAQGYKHYGGRGISICARWRNSFEAFSKDMGPRPLGASIDRINNNRGYSPKNCRWATSSEQNRNSRRTKLNPQAVQTIIAARANGETPRALATRFGVTRTTIYHVINGKSWVSI